WKGASGLKGSASAAHTGADVQAKKNAIATARTMRSLYYPNPAPSRVKIGRTPTLVLCSRNARPEKGLVRRPHVDQHGCPSKRGKASWLGKIVDARSRRQPWPLP